MTRYVELNLQIGSIRFPPGIKFWVNETLPKDAGFDVLLSGPFLAHHNVICIDPELQREMEKDGNNVELKIQRHLDFLGINRRMTKKGTSSCIFQIALLPWTDEADSLLNRGEENGPLGLISVLSAMLVMRTWVAYLKVFVPSFFDS